MKLAYSLKGSLPKAESILAVVYYGNFLCSSFKFGQKKDDSYR